MLISKPYSQEKSINIFIIEDNAINTDALVLMFREDGFNNFQSKDINSVLMKYSNANGVI